MNRLSSKIVMLIICFFSLTRIEAQNIPCDFNIDCSEIDTNLVINITMPATVSVGQQFCAAFSVETFEYILALQFNIQYDPSVIQFNNDPGDIIPGNCLSTDNNNAMLFNPTDGNIRLLWTDVLAEGNCCMDGSTLFELCFTVIGQPLDGVYLNINDVEEVAYGLDFSSTFTCGEIDSVTVNTTNTSVDCPDLSIVYGQCNGQIGQSNGSLYFVFCGGTAPYVYDVIGASEGLVDAGAGILDSQEVFVPNLEIDFYTVTVTDATGVSTSEVIFITEGTGIDVVLDGLNPSCFDRENGRVRVDYTNSSGFDATTANFSWSNNEFGKDSINFLSNGIYTVTVTDIGTGCSDTDQFELNLDTLKIFYEVIDSAGCLGGENGVVKLTATGGFPINGNEYEFMGNGVITDCHFLTDLEGGSTIEIEVEDDSWAVCRVEETFVMPFLPGIDMVGINLPAGFTSDNDSYEGFVDCNGDLLDLIEIEISNSNNFTRVLKDQFGNIITDNSILITDSGSIVSIENLPAGQYLLEISVSDPPDLDGCTRQYPINIASPPELEITGNFVAPDCAGNLGSISYMSTGGTGNHIYTINGSNTTENPIQNLDGGTYEIVVIDENLCRDSVNFSLPFAGNLQIEIDTLQGISCNSGDIGALFCNVISPCTDCTITWKDASGNVLAFGTQLINLGSGCYTACVVDNNLNCTAEATACFDPIDLITYDLNLDPPNCFGGCDGTIGVIITQGELPITFAWEGFPGLTGSVLGPVCAGSYPVAITDNTGCTVLDTIELLNPPSLELTIKDVVDPSCFGEPEGSIFVEAANGFMGNDFYDYLIYDADGNEFTTGAGQGCIEITGLISGDYTIIVSDGQCALDTPVPFTLGVPEQIMVDLDNTLMDLPSCFGFCDGGLTVEATGGTGPYTYSWVSSGLVSNQITDLCGDEYHYLFIEDATGCIVYDSIFLEQPDSLIAFLSLDPQESIVLKCAGDTNGAISIEVAGGTPDYIYTWNNNISNSNQADSLGTGIYTVTVADANGCTAIFEEELVAPEPISAEIITPLTPNCFGETTEICIGNVSGGSGSVYTFNIDNSLPFPIDSCVTVLADTYTISVIDSAGCNIDTTITIDQPAEISVDLGDDVLEIELGDSTVTLQANIISLTPVTIQWNPTDGIVCRDPLCQIVSIFPTAAQEYEVIITDEDGCTASDKIQVIINQKRNVYFPNAFSPNGDGFNDEYSLFIGDGVETVMYFGVYDRWGNLMYEVEDLPAAQINTVGWNGTFKGDEVNAGVFVYLAKLKYIDDQEITYKGSLTLLK